MSKQKEVFFFDVETSGLDPDRHEVLSIGSIPYSEAPCSTLQEYFRHTDRSLFWLTKLKSKSFYKEIRYDELIVQPEAFRVNKYIDWPVNKLEKPAEVGKAFYEHIAKSFPTGLGVHNWDVRLAGWRPEFDRAMIVSFLENYSTMKLDKTFSYKVLDVFPVACLILNREPKSLEEAFKSILKDPALNDEIKFHTSLDDALASLLIWEYSRHYLEVRRNT